MAISTSKAGRIAIIGASGYGGLQLVKLINEHPNFEISTLNGERSVGKSWNEINPFMKILVCISHVPDTTSKINFVDDDRAFDKNGVQFIINPNDEFGLTRAVWFQQKEQAEITVITIGEASCEPTLRKCLAIGANRAFRINLNPTDGFQVAQQLSAHCKEENYDLIIAGRESIDYNGAMVPGMLSAQMGYNFVTN